MNSEGKLPKARASSWWRSISRLNQDEASARWSPCASGSQAAIRSRSSAVERLVDAARARPTTEWMRLPPSDLDDLLAELAQADAAPRDLGVGGDQAQDVALRGVGVEAEQQVGRGEVEEARARATGGSAP